MRGRPWLYLKWGVRILLILILGGFLHYSLPGHDIVRVTSAFNRMTSLGWQNSWAYAVPDSGTTESTQSRDIRFVNVAYPDESVGVFRNEDTGWVWPPYFKYNSGTLQARADDLVSTKAAPKWVAVTYYGWRLPILSIYPNAISMREVAGPDVRIIPWVSIIVLLALAIGIFMLRRMWLQFWERAVEPAMIDAGEAWDAVDARADAARARTLGFFGRIGAWLGTWRDKPRR